MNFKKFASNLQKIAYLDHRERFLASILKEGLQQTFTQFKLSNKKQQTFQDFIFNAFTAQNKQLPKKNTVEEYQKLIQKFLAPLEESAFKPLLEHLKELNWIEIIEPLFLKEEELLKDPSYLKELPQMGKELKTKTPLEVEDLKTLKEKGLNEIKENLDKKKVDYQKAGISEKINTAHGLIYQRGTPFEYQGVSLIPLFFKRGPNQRSTLIIDLNEKGWIPDESYNQRVQESQFKTAWNRVYYLVKAPKALKEHLKADQMPVFLTTVAKLKLDGKSSTQPAFESFAVDIILQKLENNIQYVLLIKRKKKKPGDPDRWATPGGMIDPGENPLTSIKRELKEETGLDAKYISIIQSHQLKPAETRLKSDPRRVGTIIFDAFVKDEYTLEQTKKLLKPQPEEVEEVRWFPSSEIDTLNFAFADHKDFLQERFTPTDI